MQSDKDIIGQLTSIQEMLSNTTNDWNKRMESLQKLENFVNDKNVQYNQTFLEYYSKLTPQITLQLKDLRSAISKEACKLICISSEKLSQRYESIAVKFMHKDSLLQTISSGNKVIAENGNKCILSLIDNVQSERFIGQILDEVDTKNKNMRDRISQYLVQMVSLYDLSALEKYSSKIENTITKGLKDANQEVRQNIREAFCIYRYYFEEKADKLHQTFDPQTIRALQDNMESSGYIYEQIANSNKSFLQYQQKKPNQQNNSNNNNGKPNNSNISKSVYFPQKRAGSFQDHENEFSPNPLKANRNQQLLFKQENSKEDSGTTKNRKQPNNNNLVQFVLTSNKSSYFQQPNNINNSNGDIQINGSQTTTNKRLAQSSMGKWRDKSASNNNNGHMSDNGGSFKEQQLQKEDNAINNDKIVKYDTNGRKVYVNKPNTLYDNLTADESGKNNYRFVSPQKSNGNNNINGGNKNFSKSQMRTNQSSVQFKNNSNNGKQIEQSNNYNSDSDQKQSQQQQYQLQQSKGAQKVNFIERNKSPSQQLKKSVDKNNQNNISNLHKSQQIHMGKQQVSEPNSNKVSFIEQQQQKKSNNYQINLTNNNNNNNGKPQFQSPKQQILKNSNLKSPQQQQAAQKFNSNKSKSNGQQQNYKKQQQQDEEEEYEQASSSDFEEQEEINRKQQQQQQQQQKKQKQLQFQQQQQQKQRYQQQQKQQYSGDEEEDEEEEQNYQKIHQQQQPQLKYQQNNSNSRLQNNNYMNPQIEQKQQILKQNQQQPNGSTQQLQNGNSNGNNLNLNDEDINYLIEKGNNSNWATRVTAFESLLTLLESAVQQQQQEQQYQNQNQNSLDSQISLETFKNLAELHVNKLSDSHFKVIAVSQQSIVPLFQWKQNLLFPFLNQILPKLLVNLTDSKERVSKQSNIVLNYVQKIYNADDLITPILKFLETQCKQVVKICSLEVLSIIVKDSQSFYNNGSNVRQSVQLLSFIMSENYNIKAVILPCLGLLLSIRDHNPQQTFHSILSLPSQNQVSSIRLLACQYAPDLENDLRQFTLNPNYSSTNSNQNNNNIIQNQSDIDNNNSINTNQLKKRNSSKKSSEIVNQSSNNINNTQQQQQKRSSQSQLNKNQNNGQQQQIQRGDSNEIGDLDDLDQVINNFEDNQEIIVQSINEILNTIIENFTNLQSHSQIQVLNIMHKLFQNKFQYSNINPDSVQMCLQIYHKLPKQIDIFAVDEIIEDMLDCIPNMTGMKALVDIIGEEKPPYLQTYVKKISYIINKSKREQVSPFIDHLMDVFKLAINDQSPDVRKSVIFCLVDLHFLFGQEIDAYFQMFTLNQQKLVAIYIKRRLEQSQQQQQ